jgi:dihydroflavonol-4-reductase
MKLQFILIISGGAMKILITGGTGFIGMELIKRLRLTPHEMVCLARSPRSVDALQAQGIEVVRGDVTEKASMVSAMRGCGWVVNLANFYEFWNRDTRTYDKVNVEGTRNVLQAARETGVSKIVHVSSVVAYGNASWPITETTPFGDRMPGHYARTKRAGEAIAQEYYAKFRLPVVIVSPAGVMGPNDPKATGRYIKSLVQGKLPTQVLTKCPFPFVHVRDVAEVIVRVLEKEKNEGEKYLVAAENLTFGAINKMVSEIAYIKLPALTLPAPLVVAGAYGATFLAKLTGQPPILDMSIEQIRMMKQGMKVDGSKAVRELGIAYTPIRTALKEMISSLQLDR